MKHFFCEWKPGSGLTVNPIHDLAKNQYCFFRGISIFFSGRIDDRKSLISLAEAPSYETDAELLGKAYYNYGIPVFSQICGDFSIAIYDNNRSDFIIARDAMGISPLFYCDDLNGNVKVSTQFRDLLIRHQRYELDHRYFANYATYDLSNYTDLTPYIGIKRVKPGCYLKWSDNAELEEKVFWVPSQAEIHYKSQDDYIEHFKDLFTNAISDRMRGAKRISIDLSGGLDSSSITCIASKISKSFNTEIITITHDYPSESMADERVYVDSVLREYQETIPVRISGSEHWMLRDAMKVPRFDEPNPRSLFHSQTEASANASSELGATVHMTGFGGDTVLGTEPYYLGKMFLRGKWKELLRENKSWALFKKQSGGRIFYTNVIYPLLPLFLKRFIASRKVPTNLKVDFLLNLPPEWLTPEVRRLVEDDPILLGKMSYELEWNIKSIFQNGDMTYYNNVFFPKGIQVRHPFMDRRLVEYLLRIPGHIKMQPPYMKVLLRKAMKGILPERIRFRRDKGEFNIIPLLGLKKENVTIQQWIRNPLASTNNIVNSEILQVIFKKWSFGVIDYRDCYLLLSLEHWFQSLNKDG